MKASWFVLWAALIVSVCWADDVRAEGPKLLGGGWSYHMDRDKYPNETHGMVGLAYKGWSAIHFTNSFDRESWGVGYEWLPITYRNVQVGGYAALWTGYEEEGYKHARPMAALRGTVWLDRFGVAVSTAFTVTTLHLEWRL